MTGYRLLALALFGSVVFSPTANAVEINSYKSTELLAICMDADNDSREVGEAARIECEQYVLGFADALSTVGGLGADKGICLPKQNIAAEIRWAFTKWVHENYSERHQPASKGLYSALKAKFPCK